MKIMSTIKRLIAKYYGGERFKIKRYEYLRELPYFLRHIHLGILSC